MNSGAALPPVVRGGGKRVKAYSSPEGQEELKLNERAPVGQRGTRAREIGESILLDQEEKSRKRDAKEEAKGVIQVPNALSAQEILSLRRAYANELIDNCKILCKLKQTVGCKQEGLDNLITPNLKVESQYVLRCMFRQIRRLIKGSKYDIFKE